MSSWREIFNYELSFTVNNLGQMVAFSIEKATMTFGKKKITSFWYNFVNNDRPMKCSRSVMAKQLFAS